MKNHKTFFGLLTLFVLVFGLMSYPVQADVTYTEVEGKVTIETDNIWIEVTGESNVPAYFFKSQADANETRHRAQFVELFEFEDNNNNLRYDENDTRVDSTIVSMASLDVALGAVAETGGSSTEVSFNMSLTAKSLIDLQFTEVNFENHVSADNETRLKFNVIIDNYTFSLNGDMLGLSFKLSSTESSTTNFSENNESSSVAFGQNAYLESKNTAQVGNTEVNVSMTVNETAEGEIMTYFAYPEFSGQLVHDPALGVDDSNDDTSDTTENTGNDIEDQALSLPVLGLTSLALLSLMRRKFN